MVEHSVDSLTLPGVRAKYAPVHWEPLPGSGERIVAILLVAPDAESSALLSPAAHVVLNSRRLRAMLGAQRGESALGILNEVAAFMTRRLLAGDELKACTPPFRHFTVGGVRHARGFTAEQVLDAAVQSVAAFGSADDLIDEVLSTPNTSTQSTREFLQRVQVAFAPADDDRRKRFGRAIQTSAGDFVIDYVHHKHLVQFTTAPITDRQEPLMRKEAEAKLMELLTVHMTVMDKKSVPSLVINAAPLQAIARSNEARRVADRALRFFRDLAGTHGIEAVEVASHEEAALQLGLLDGGIRRR